MKLSYIIVTHNRRESLLRTLHILETTTPLRRDEWEAWVVDNGSTDGTCGAVRQKFPATRILAREANEGVWARSYAFEKAAGAYVILLDDDSYPTGNAAPMSISYLEANPQCAAVVGRVVLPDGSLEACAFPGVMLSGAVCLRRAVLGQIGSFRREFFRKAGEYDFSFRLWGAGYSVERFEDVVYRHDKVQTGRSAPFAHRMDLRNNLILVERYLPKRLRGIYRADWTQRYAALARQAGCAGAARRAIWEARAWRVREALAGRQTLPDDVVENIWNFEAQCHEVREWSRQNDIKRAVISDFSKNLYATFDACRQSGLEVLRIADVNPAFHGLRYRGIRVSGETEAWALKPQGVIISNVNAAQIDRIADRIQSGFSGPVLRLWQPALHSSRRAAA